MPAGETGLHARLARLLPDIPLYVETRSMLLDQRCELFGVRFEGGPEFVARDPEEKLIAVVGRPEGDAIREAVYRNQGEGEIICSPESEQAVQDAAPDWHAVAAVLHSLPDRSRLADVPEGAVRLLEREDLASLDLPAGMKAEFVRAVGRGWPLAAGMEGSEPVSFCYAGSPTEGLWDVAIETLEPYRRQGHAAACASHLIRLMDERGKQPVWGALEANEASRRLAGRLGFQEVDRIIVFEPAG